MARRTGARPRPRSEGASHREAGPEEAETSGERRRGKSEPVKILIKYSMVML